MGYNPRINVVIGVKFNKDELVRVQHVKAFPHDFPEDWKVDPKTGRPLWKQKKTYLLDPIQKYKGECPEEFEAVSTFGLIRGALNARFYVISNTAHWCTGCWKGMNHWNIPRRKPILDLGTA